MRGHLHHFTTCSQRQSRTVFARVKVVTLRSVEKYTINEGEEMKNSGITIRVSFWWTACGYPGAPCVLIQTLIVTLHLAEFFTSWVHLFYIALSFYDKSCCILCSALCFSQCFQSERYCLCLSTLAWIVLFLPSFHLHLCTQHLSHCSYPCQPSQGEFDFWAGPGPGPGPGPISPGLAAMCSSPEIITRSQWHHSNASLMID